MSCVNKIMSLTTAILHLFSQETNLLMKVIMKCVNIKLWDIPGCFHYILNAPRTLPHNLIKEKLTKLIEQLFNREGSLYLACNDKNAFFYF